MTTEAPAKPARGLNRAAVGYAKPRTYEELRAVLSSGTVHFPKRLRQVAIFLWQHPSDVALGTISQVAAKAGVQPSTLVRFAQIFGYAGFSDFQGIFKAHMKGSWPDGRAAAGAARRKPAPSSTDSSPPRRPRSARLGDGFDIASFERMVALLAEADLIHVIGSKRAFPVTAYVSLALSQQGVRNVARRQRRLRRARPGRLRRRERRGAGCQLQPLQFHHARPRRRGARAQGTHRLDHRQHIQPAGQAVRGLVEVIESDFAGFRSLAASLAVGMALVHGVVARRAAD